MILLMVNDSESGGRLDKFVARFLKEAPTSFIYKMLRKKNITLNGNKATGAEKLIAGDEIKLFLADETVIKFGGKVESSPNTSQNISATDRQIHEEYEKYKVLRWPYEKPQIIYEDEDILVINKPADVLSQGAEKDDISLNDYIIYYLITEKNFTEDNLRRVRPSVTNRLDRNTSGLILAGKTLAGLRFLSEIIKERKIEKYYLTLVKGKISEKRLVNSYLLKSRTHNQVKIFNEPHEDASFISTEYEPLAFNDRATLLRVKLITGKSHQIRAHLAYLGHPVIGDPKYGDKRENTEAARLGIHFQLLHSYETVFPEDCGDKFARLNGKRFYAMVPDYFLKTAERYKIAECLHGAAGA